MTIEEILAGESKNVEFKESLPDKSIKYMKSVVAFANGTGGKTVYTSVWPELPALQTSTWLRN